MLRLKFSKLAHVEKSGVRGWGHLDLKWAGVSTNMQPLEVDFEKVLHLFLNRVYNI